MQIKGKTVLITGAAKRVGRQIALTLAERGADIAVHYNRSRSEAQALVRLIESRFKVKAAAFQTELFHNAPAVQTLVKDVVRHFGSLHVLVNSASIYEKSGWDSSEEDWDRHLDTNLKTPFFLSQEAARQMKKQGEGKIINLCDWSGLRPYADYIPYCVSKSGLIYLTHALAKALAPEIQVNAVLPGPILLPENFSQKAREAVIRATPLKRIGNPQDVANTVLFLIEGSDFITGALIPVDGGRLIA